MTNLEQRSGITYYFRVENEAAAKRFEAALQKNNAAMKEVDKSFKQTADGATKSMRITSDAVDDAAKKTEQSSRKFIKSISGIYAGFVLLPRVAQEAGEAIKAAAADEDVVSSYERLAEEAEVSAERLLAAMKKASKGTVTEIELMREANRAFLAGGAEFARAIPQLFEIARATAAATGQEVIFVMDSLVKGIAKASIKLIDNAEVYIKVGKAVEDYAKASGRTADELDEVERRQAILNVVLEQGREIIQDIGGDVDLATDAFNRYDTQLIDAKRSTIDFFREALGDENLARFKQFTDLLVTASPVLQSLALLSLAGLPVAKIGAMAVALGVSVVALDKFLEGANELDQALQTTAEEFETAEDEIYGVRTGILSVGEALDETKKSFLIVGQTAAIMFDDIINGTDDSLERIKALNDPMRQWVDNVIDGAMAAGILGAAEGIMAAEAEKAAAKAERLAAAMEELARREEEAAEVRPDIERALKAIQKSLDKRRDLYEDYNEDLEDEMRRHARRMEELSIDAAFDRQDAIRDHNDDRTENERDLQRDIEDAQREHGFRLEDIERRFQRRMTEIRELYERTVTKAGRRRDVLSIINAREQRAIEERDARRDRDEGIFVENRNFQERLRQAIQAHQDSLSELKDSLAEELREIDENLRRRQEKEERAHQDRLAKLALRHARRMIDLEIELTEQNDLIKKKRNEIQSWLNLHPINVPVRYGSTGNPAIPLQHGFSGMVQGPQTFKVEPGVTEFIHASGNLSGLRETPAPSASATSAMALSHSIRGGVGVGVSGLSSQVLGNIGPQLQDTVGQAVIDALTTGILASL